MRKFEPTHVLLKKLWGYIGRKRKVQFFFLFIMMLVTSVASCKHWCRAAIFDRAYEARTSFQPSIGEPHTGAFLIEKPEQLILPICVLFCVAALFAGLARLMLLTVQTRLCHAIGADLSIQVFRKTLYQDYAEHIQRNSSEIIATVANKASTVVYDALTPILLICSSALLVTSIMFILVSSNPTVSLIAFTLLGLLYVTIIMSVRTRLNNYSKIISKNQNAIFKALQEGLQGIRDVLINGTQEVYCRHYRSADLPLRRSLAMAQILGHSPRYIIEALGMVVIALVAYVFVGSGAKFIDAIPFLGMLALSAQRLLPLLHQTYSSWAMIMTGREALADVIELLDKEEPHIADVTNIEPLPFADCITFKNVEFSYNLADTTVFTNLT